MCCASNLDISSQPSFVVRIFNVVGLHIDSFDYFTCVSPDTPFRFQVFQSIPKRNHCPEERSGKIRHLVRLGDLTVVDRNVQVLSAWDVDQCFQAVSRRLREEGWILPLSHASSPGLARYFVMPSTEM